MQRYVSLIGQAISVRGPRFETESLCGDKTGIIISELLTRQVPMFGNLPSMTRIGVIVLWDDTNRFQFVDIEFCTCLNPVNVVTEFYDLMGDSVNQSVYETTASNNSDMEADSI